MDKQSELERILGWVPIEVVKARHRAVVKDRCVCGAKRQPGEVKGGRIVMRTTTGGTVRARAFITCERCLGTIKTLSDDEVRSHFEED